MKMMNLCCLIVALLLFVEPVAILAQSSTDFSQEIQVYIASQAGRERVQFDIPPVTRGGKVFVPLRGVFEKLGASVKYQPSTRQIWCEKEGTSLYLQVGSSIGMLNGRSLEVSPPPFSLGGRVLVPLRLVGEALGAQVSWEAALRMIVITPSSVQASASSPGGPPSAGSSTPPSSGATYPPQAPAAPSYPPQPPPAPQPSQPVITSFFHSATGPLVTGNVVSFTMIGTPGGQASFAIPGVVEGIPLIEVRSGQYEGSWQVTREFSTLPVVGKLRIGGSETQAIAPQSLSAHGREDVIERFSPQTDERVSTDRPTLSVIFGHEIAVDEQSVRLYLDAAEISPSLLQKTSDFVAWTPQTPLSSGKHLASVLGRTRDGRVFSREWSFFIEEKGNIFPFGKIQSVSHNATAPLSAGQVITVTMKGEPGGAATFDIGSWKGNLPMQEQFATPGTYVGTYTIQAGDAVQNAVITGRLVTRTGQKWEMAAQNPVSILGGIFLVIAQPTEGGGVRPPLVIQGRTAPYATVSLTLKSSVSIIPKILEVGETLGNVQARADRDGYFQASITFMPRPARTRYLLTAVAQDSSGALSDAVNVNLVQD